MKLLKLIIPGILSIALIACSAEVTDTADADNTEQSEECGDDCKKDCCEKDKEECSADCEKKCCSKDKHECTEECGDDCKAGHECTDECADECKAKHDEAHVCGDDCKDGCTAHDDADNA